MRNLSLLLIAVLIGEIASAQDLRKDLEMVKKYYSSAGKKCLMSTYQLFGKSGQKIEEKTGYTVMEGVSIYSEMEGTKVIENKKLTMKIDDSKKIIFIQPLQNAKERHEMFLGNVWLLDSIGCDINFIGTSLNRKKYVLNNIQNSTFSKIEFEITQNGAIVQISYFRKRSGGDQKLTIKYAEVNSIKGVKYQDVVKWDGRKFIGKLDYSNYKVISSYVPKK